MQIYNTFSRQKESFETLEEGVVSLYVCGPTVYDNAHIGHAMSSLVFDVIRRYLTYKGYEVRHVMNYTDVDDKIIQRANQTREDPTVLAERYIDAYMTHLEDLHILPPTDCPRVSEEIDMIIDYISRLAAKGCAYPLAGDVYFRVEAYDDYGKLSRRELAQMRPGIRVNVDDRKENPADFALWKTAKPGEPAWDSPWGAGRPGWHIKCSAMSLIYLGEQIDIHGGGNDLIFPHHENEIAQSESLTGKRFARYWVHNGMLKLGDKMSKSTGNVITIEEFLKKHEADVLRMVVLNSHYRSPLDFGEVVVEQGQKALDRLRSALRRSLPGEGLQADTDALAEETARARAGFEAQMDDDFNTAGAMSCLFDLVRAINRARDAGVELDAAQAVLTELAGVLGLTLDAAQESSVAPFIELLLEVREELRAARQWALSDRIRDELNALGVDILDGKGGSTWRYK